MRYNTGNPVGSDGSSSPFDLHDNSGNLDLAANDRSSSFFFDRTGKRRKTIWGMEQQVNDFLASQGYEPVVLEYVDGQELVIDRSTQLIQRAGILYSARLPATFPVVLSGEWLDDQAELVTQVDRDLRAMVIELEKSVAPFAANVTLNIPGDFPDLQEALDSLSTKGATLENRVDILIAAGHALRRGFRIVDKDMSFVTIKSVDAVVAVRSDFVHTSNNDIGLDQIVARTSKIGFLSIRSKAPVWDILVDMSPCPTVYGYVLNAGSYGYIRSNKGVQGTMDVAEAAGTNLVVGGNSTLDAMHGIAKEGYFSGITVTHRSNANIAELQAQGTRGIGIDVSRGSTVYCNLANVSGRNQGLYARRSFVSAQGLVCDSCVENALLGNFGAKIEASSAVFTGPRPTFGYIQIAGGVSIDATDATVNGALLTKADCYLSTGLNKVTGRGVIYAQHAQDSHPFFLSNGIPSRQISGSLSVAPLSYAAAFSRTDFGYFAGGVVFGDDVGFKLTCDGAVLIDDTSRVIGGSQKSVAYIPPFSFASSCTLEIYNRGAVTAAVAYRLTEYR